MAFLCCGEAAVFRAHARFLLLNKWYNADEGNNRKRQAKEYIALGNDHCLTLILDYNVVTATESIENWLDNYKKAKPPECTGV